MWIIESLENVFDYVFKWPNEVIGRLNGAITPVFVMLVLVFVWVTFRTIQGFFMICGYLSYTAIKSQAKALVRPICIVVLLWAFFDQLFGVFDGRHELVFPAVGYFILRDYMTRDPDTDRIRENAWTTRKHRSKRVCVVGLWCWYIMLFFFPMKYLYSRTWIIWAAASAIACTLPESSFR